MKENDPKTFFTPDEEQQIASAIHEAELKTSGEIRVHLAKKIKKSAFDDATQLFEKLKMTETAEKNGVLIYLAVQDHQFAVVGDTGIHQKVTPDFWDKIRDAMQQEFKKGQFAKGIVDAIHICGQELARYFSRQSHDANELSNDISRED